ncbi:MAG: glycosyltransferase [Desulfovibrio sp.]|uniref:glycosyltransferase n=1 Tax=Desulfovibrio sp. 7SRBS1 TaxID=3378064 RepID=UPI003B4102B9
MTLTNKTSIARACIKSLPATLFYLVLAAGLLAAMPDDVWYLWERGAYTFGLFGIWRYSWQFIHLVRHWIYMKRVYPRLRASADANANQWPRHIYVVVPSFQEMPEISEQVFRSIARELATTPCQATIVANVGSREEMNLVTEVVRSEPGADNVELVLMEQKQGKRRAIGHALRTVARLANDPFRHHADKANDLCILMDGDSVLGHGTLQKCASLFADSPALGAVTTRNRPLTLHANTALHDWYNLKFAQRHHVFASHSLSRRVLTLTGRCSMFRMQAIMTEEFIHTVENDHVEHWLFGHIPFLMGDDKSTWYVLLRKGWEMLYVPDATVWAVEERDSNFISTSVSLMHRWFGNMLRNNGRALAIGPKPMGGFIWWCILDQRFTVWTPLVGPVCAAMLALSNSVYYLLFYVVWVIYTRLIMLWFYVLEGSDFNIAQLPLMLYNQWMGSLVKIRCLHNLARQRWNKGGTTHEVKAQGGWHGAARVFMSLNIAFFLLLFSLASGALPVDLHGFGRTETLVPQVMAAPADNTISLNDITPGQDISPRLQTILAQANATEPLRIILPDGLYRLDTPLRITRSNVTLQGAGREKTFLVSTAKAAPNTKENALLYIRGGRGPLLPPLASPVRAGRRVLHIPSWPKDARFIWLSAPNTPEFLDSIGDTAWRKKTPQLRQRFYHVVDSTGGFVFIARPLDIDLPAGTQVSAPHMLTGIHLRDFALEQQVPGRVPPFPKNYANTAPEYAVDGIRFQWAADCTASDMAIINAGRHPLDFDRALDCAAANMFIQGAWNKGRGGNGYVRFARAFGCSLSDSTVRAIRHLAFQWSSADNTVTNSTLETDVNFHGGFSSRNRVVDCVLAPPPYHKWGKVTRMRQGGDHWASPDGPGNVVMERTSEKMSAKVQSAKGQPDKDQATK